jgi:hypothetical protein
MLMLNKREGDCCAGRAVRREEKNRERERERERK